MAKKEEGKKVEAKKASTKKTPKVQRLRAEVRVTHKSKTYEVGEFIEEEDKEMIKQLVDKGLAKKV